MSNPARFELDGELTIYRAAECKALLLQALAGNARLDIHLWGVTEIDTAGVQLLLLARREAAARGGRVVLRAPSAPVQQVFGLLDLTNQFDIDTVAA